MDAETDVAGEPSFLQRSLRALTNWFDAGAYAEELDDQDDGIDWLRTIPFLGVHLACIAVLWVGWSPVASSLRAQPVIQGLVLP